MRKQIAAMIVVLDGLDVLVFTGGVGESVAQVRDEQIARRTWALVA